MLLYIDDRPDGIELHVDSSWLKELMKFLIYLLLGYISRYTEHHIFHFNGVLYKTENK